MTVSVAPTWGQISARQNSSEKTQVAVFLTTPGAGLRERLRFAAVAKDLLERRSAGLVTAAGCGVAEALDTIGAPPSAVGLLVVSPHVAERATLIADIRARWPSAAFFGGGDAARGYIMVDVTA